MSDSVKALVIFLIGFLAHLVVNRVDNGDITPSLVYPVFIIILMVFILSLNKKLSGYGGVE